MAFNVTKDSLAFALVFRFAGAIAPHAADAVTPKTKTRHGNLRKWRPVRIGRSLRRSARATSPHTTTYGYCDP